LLSAGLVPSDSFMAAQCDMVIDMVHNLFVPMVKFFYEKNIELKVWWPIHGM